MPHTGPGRQIKVPLYTRREDVNLSNKCLAKGAVTHQQRGNDENLDDFSKPQAGHGNLFQSEMAVVVGIGV